MDDNKAHEEKSPEYVDNDQLHEEHVDPNNVVHEEIVEEEEIDPNDMIHVEDDHGLEEVVTEPVYNEAGEIVAYEDVVVYEEEQIVEEYVDLDNLPEDSYYVYTDANGVNRFLSHNMSNVEEVVGEEIVVKDSDKIGEIVDEHFDHERLSIPKRTMKNSGSSLDDQPGPSQPKRNVRYETADRSSLHEYHPALSQHYRSKINKGSVASTSKHNIHRPTIRTVLEKDLNAELSNEELRYYKQYDDYEEEEMEVLHQPPRKQRLSELAKVDVEKYRMPKGTIVDESMPVLNEEDIVERAAGEDEALMSKQRIPYFPARAPHKSEKEKMMEKESKRETFTDHYPKNVPDENIIRVFCPDCDNGFGTVEKMCHHMNNTHDIEANVKSGDFYAEKDFESFLDKMEVFGCNAKEMSVRVANNRKKGRPGVSQYFKCNYFDKNRKAWPEMAETNHAFMADNPSEACTAFVLKIHNYATPDNIRVKYCDVHTHFEGGLDFRTPLAIKRRMFEMSYKRLPFAVIHEVLKQEMDSLLPAGSKFADKLKTLTENEMINILVDIHSTVKQPERGYRRPGYFAKEKKIVGQSEDTSSRSHGNEGIDLDIDQNNGVHDDMDGSRAEDKDIPLLNRDEQIDITGTTPEPEGDDEQMMGETDEATEREKLHAKYYYNPAINKDSLVEDLMENELTALTEWERDNGIVLTDEQLSCRLRMRMKFILAQTMNVFSSLDSATHGLSPNDMPIQSIEHMRQLASGVLEMVCGVEAEIRSQYMTTPLEQIKGDLITAVANREKLKPSIDRSPRKRMSFVQKQWYDREEDRNNAIYDRVKSMAPPHRAMGINLSGTFNIPEEPPVKRSLPPAVVSYLQRPIIDISQKGSPWTGRRKRAPRDPNAPPPKRRARPSQKKNELVDVKHEGEMSTKGLEPEEKKSIPKLDEDIGSFLGCDDVMEPVNITTDDNVPQAIAMGVEHEVEITTDNVVKTPQPQPQPQPKRKKTATNLSALEVLATASEVHAKKRKGSESNRSRTASESSTKEPETPVTTRTGRVVKPKKWNE